MKIGDVVKVIKICESNQEWLNESRSKMLGIEGEICNICVFRGTEVNGLSKDFYGKKLYSIKSSDKNNRYALFAEELKIIKNCEGEI